MPGTKNAQHPRARKDADRHRGLKPDQAAAISHAVQQAAEHGKHVTPDEFKAGIAELRAEISRGIGQLRSEVSRAESRIIKWVVGIVLTAAGIVTAAGVTVGLAILRALGALAGGQRPLR